VDPSKSFVQGKYKRGEVLKLYRQTEPCLDLRKL
jgi:hypothetical protein